MKYRIVERTDDNLRVTFIVETLVDTYTRDCSAEWKPMTHCTSFNAAKSYLRRLTFTDKVVYEVEI